MEVDSCSSSEEGKQEVEHRKCCLCKVMVPVYPDPKPLQPGEMEGVVVPHTVPSEISFNQYKEVWLCGKDKNGAQVEVLANFCLTCWMMMNDIPRASLEHRYSGGGNLRSGGHVGIGGWQQPKFGYW
jgi:hypothetical protein